jgi:hypothetical protein
LNFRARALFLDLPDKNSVGTELARLLIDQASHVGRIRYRARQLEGAKLAVPAIGHPIERLHLASRLARTDASGNHVRDEERVRGQRREFRLPRGTSGKHQCPRDREPRHASHRQ